MTGVLMKRGKLVHKGYSKRKDDVERRHREKMPIYKPRREPRTESSLPALRKNEPYQKNH